MNALRLAWSGEERLWKVFWIFGFAFNIVLFLIAHEVDVHARVMFGMLSYILACLYFIFSAILLWRCAFNAESRIWGYAVKLLVICGVVFQAFFLDYILFIKPSHNQQSRGRQLYVNELPKHSAIRQRETAPAAAITDVPFATKPVVNKQEQYKAICEQTMADYARKNGADPQQYITQNQAYIQQCVQYYMSKDTTGR